MEETGKEKRYSREPEANQIKKRDRRRKKGSLTVEAYKMSFLLHQLCNTL